MVCKIENQSCEFENLTGDVAGGEGLLDTSGLFRSPKPDGSACFNMSVLNAASSASKEKSLCHPSVR